MKEDCHYPARTPKSVVQGKAHFVKDYLLIKAIHDAGYTPRSVSVRVFWNRGKKHAPNKVEDWIKYRYPAMDEDLIKVWRFIDPRMKYNWRDFCFTNYQSDEFWHILNVYRGYADQKIRDKRRAKIRQDLAKGDDSYHEQTSLF